MPTLVADLELTTALPLLDLPPGTTGVLALVRSHGRPVGVLRLKASGRVAADRLEAALAEQVSRPLEGAALPAPASPVSIVVCTRDRPDDLSRCLESLRPQAAAGHEVIVVDNCPGDERTANVAAAFPCRYVREPRPGLDRARNRGLSAASHEIVAYTDDDCAPDPRWVDALVAPYADPSVDATTGLVMPLELDTPAQERFETYCANRRTFEPRTFRRSDTPPSTAGVVGLGANMSVRRARLLALGGFDERFDGGMPTLSGGDTEMFARLLEAGATVSYRPDALVWHRHRRDCAAVRRVIFGYGVGVFAVLWKRLAEDGDLGVLVTAPRWMLGPPLKAAWNALRRRPATPLDLVWMELWGALHGPWRYLASRRLVSAARLET